MTAWLVVECQFSSCKLNGLYLRVVGEQSGSNEKCRSAFSM